MRFLLTLREAADRPISQLSRLTRAEAGASPWATRSKGRFCLLLGTPLPRHPSLCVPHAGTSSLVFPTAPEALPADRLLEAARWPGQGWPPWGLADAEFFGSADDPTSPALALALPRGCSERLSRVLDGLPSPWSCSANRLLPGRLRERPRGCPRGNAAQPRTCLKQKFQALGPWAGPCAGRCPAQTDRRSCPRLRLRLRPAVAAGSARSQVLWSPEGSQCGSAGDWSVV